MIDTNDTYRQSDEHRADRARKRARAQRAKQQGRRELLDARRTYVTGR